MKLIFEWNENKTKANLRNHKVSFDEAKTIFNDPNIITFPDELHSQDEERLISIGFSTNNRLLLVVHTEQFEIEDAIIIRIISCRKPTALERKIYEE
jgi:hypothetical protein